MTQPDADSTASRLTFRRLLPLIILLVLIGLVFFFRLDQYLSFETLEDYHEVLRAFVEANPVLAALAFILVYIASVALSVPGAVFLTIAGGYLFGLALGAALVVIGATTGALGVFLIARTSLGEPLRARAGPFLKRMEEGFRRNALNYLLVLRLIPIFPFWIVNVVPAFLGVPLHTYALATFFGIIPGSIVYASVGNGLGAVIETGGQPDLGIILKPEVLGPILGLAALALLPVIIRRFRGRNVPLPEK